RRCARRRRPGSVGHHVGLDVRVAGRGPGTRRNGARVVLRNGPRWRDGDPLRAAGGLMSAQGSDAMAGRIAMAVHGGAWSIPASERTAHRSGSRAALERGLEVLREGGSALDAVEAAIRTLEDDGTFDAGRGSFLDEDGQISLDAGIMDGESLNTG